MAPNRRLVKNPLILVFATKWKKSKHFINLTSSLTIHTQDYPPRWRNKHKHAQLKTELSQQTLFLCDLSRYRALSWKAQPFSRCACTPKGEDVTKRCGVQHLPLLGVGSACSWLQWQRRLEPKGLQPFYLHRKSEWSKSNYYFSHFEITWRGSSILLQIEFHKLSKQFGLSLRNRLSSSFLSSSSGGGQCLLSLISAAGWNQHKFSITIQNTITFFTLLIWEKKKKPVCLKN